MLPQIAFGKTYLTVKKVCCVVVELQCNKFFFELSRYAWKTVLEPITA